MAKFAFWLIVVLIGAGLLFLTKWIFGLFLPKTVANILGYVVTGVIIIPITIGKGAGKK